ncbi:hypothetical protein L1887_59029 [Cichorium endivia]|nr:hypothetical protein L1887_59029 [Cichorium endivia]
MLCKLRCVYSSQRSNEEAKRDAYTSWVPVAAACCHLGSMASRRQILNRPWPMSAVILAAISVCRQPEKLASNSDANRARNRNPEAPQAGAIVRPPTSGETANGDHSTTTDEIPILQAIPQRKDGTEH